MSEKPILFSTSIVRAIFTGGETGPGARPMHPDWARLDRDQCQVSGTPFFFKSWGDWLWLHPVRFYRVGKTKAGRLLDGREWSQYPGAGI